MDDHDQTPQPTEQPTEQTAARRPWRERIPTGRKAVTAGALVAGLAIGGAGFGAGYAVGDGGAATTVTTQQGTPDWGDGGFRGGPPDQMGGGPMGGQGDGTTQGDGGTGLQPDFDGDGQPDTDSGTTSDSGALNS